MVPYTRYKDISEQVKDDIVYDYNENYMSQKELQKKYHLGWRNIKSVLGERRVGIRQGVSNFLFTKKEEEEICKLYQEGLSCLEISRRLNVTEKTIRARIKKYNLPIRDNAFYRTKYTFDTTFFDEINTEEKAYWLGFIYADGFVSGDRKVGISLHVKDEDHLMKFKSCIKSNHPLNVYKGTTGYGYTEYARIILCNKHFYSQCVNKGILQHKTTILLFPREEIVPTNLIHHFIRGYFDGDGSLKIDHKISILGTKEFLSGVNKALPLDKTFNLYQRWDRDVNNYTLEIGGKNQVKSVLEYFYKNATIYLQRKYERYLNFMKQTNK